MSKVTSKELQEGLNTSTRHIANASKVALEKACEECGEISTFMRRFSIEYYQYLHDNINEIAPGYDAPRQSTLMHDLSDGAENTFAVVLEKFYPVIKNSIDKI